MTAAAERAAFAAAGRDLIRGEVAARRGEGLLRMHPEPPSRIFAALLDTPQWLRWPDTDRRRLAEAVALRSIAPALARSIDGVWLGALAEVAGDDAIDWAIARGAREDEEEGRDGEATLTPESLMRRGSAILASALPPAMRSYLREGASDAVMVEEGIIEEALAFVAERER